VIAGVKKGDMKIVRAKSALKVPPPPKQPIAFREQPTTVSAQEIADMLKP
jgi:hypothetical protein